MTIVFLPRRQSVASCKVGWKTCWLQKDSSDFIEKIDVSRSDAESLAIRQDELWVGQLLKKAARSIRIFKNIVN